VGKYREKNIFKKENRKREQMEEVNREKKNQLLKRK
jgi:hypothetical protein